MISSNKSFQLLVDARFDATTAQIMEAANDESLLSDLVEGFHANDGCHD